MNVEDFELLLPKAAPDPLVVPRWGVVTQMSPLVVQLAGDVEPLAVTPKALVGGLSVGDAVWCILQSRDLLVVGKAAAAAVCAMSRAATGPSLAAATWTQITDWGTPEKLHGMAANPAAGTITVQTPGRYDLHWRQRWQYFGSAFRRHAAIVLGTAAPTATATNVLAANVSSHNGWYAQPLHEPEVYLDAGAVLTFWAYSETAATYANTTSSPLPPVDRVVVRRSP